ncbi:outer membrane biogenesis protein BamB [Gemmata sp. SH-PL17]|uniref:outer membrane protein assembly factor BamB family protein n=1 Tax=Gemmata sp. SH-PL17 TaxID=1630693 RepID=UPI00078B439E|nr:PQQ-binding-like beta-propeller repeat protein [Gemmata sp. SH-PL17]AMV24506.1 outer membrane biogenesis protein BamB [Gemmata sp. SH-PL17]
MNRAVRAAATLCLLLAAPAARAQPPAQTAPEPANLRGESAQTRKRLLEIEQKILAGKHADAADELQRVLDESGSDLILVGANQARPARWFAHQLLAKLPGDTLKAYQDRIDQPAKQLLAQAKQARDPRPLYQLQDRYFVSRPADEALLLLGDLLFERGEFRAAEDSWRRLLPAGGADVTYPNSKADHALVWARVVLAAIFAGDTPRAKIEFDAFKAKHATATGTLAGKTGPLADTLRTFLSAPPKLASESPSRSWATYGGGPERTGRVAGGLPRFESSVPWKQITIEPKGGHPPARPPLGHPVITNGEVFVADSSRVFGFDLRTGTRTREVALDPNVSPPNNNQTNPPPDSCCSLTAADGLLYARFGPPIVRAPLNANKTNESFLCCLRPEGRDLKIAWKLAPPEDPKVPAAWEGAPIVVGKRLWAVYAKFEGGRVIHVAVGYDPIDGNAEPQRPAWATELCDSAPSVTSNARQELLTLAGRHLVFCSNSGAVVAVDSHTGQRSWAYRYPRARKSASASSDPSPAVAFDGRVFVAPADGERVYALDARTGQLVWESGPTEGARIVGVARGRLIVSVSGPLRSLRALALDTGSHRREDGGWVLGGSGTLPYGQGFVTDDIIVWPSHHGLYFLQPEGGLLPPGRPNPWQAPLPHFLARYFGNLAYADGVLVVVTPTQVWFYRAESTKIVPRPDSTPRDRFDWIVERAERQFAAGDRPAAIAALAQVATGGLPAPMRAWAAARLLQWSPQVTSRDQLAREVQDALRPELVNEWVIAPDGLPVTLGDFLQKRLGRTPVRAFPPALVLATKSCTPDLTPESEFAHTQKLPTEVSPLPAMSGEPGPPKHIFAAGLQKIIAIPLDRGAESEHVAVDLFTHASDVRDGFVAAGPRAVALYGAARDPIWVFRLPATERLPNGPLPIRVLTEGPTPVPDLSSFVLSGSWLFARIGEHHLVALDLQARRVVWVLGATGRNGYESLAFASTPRFGPHFAVTEKYIIAQLSDGRRWFIKLETGRPAAQPVLGERTARVNWPHAPATLSENQLALADGPGLVRLVSLGGRVRWAYEVEHEDGLAGEPPQVRSWGNSVLIAVRRNYGVDIECVDATTGKPVWNDPAFADAFRIDLFASAADAAHVYVPAENTLLGISLDTGKTEWTANLPGLPDTTWTVRAGKSCVIAYPTRAIPRESMDTVLARVTRSFRAEPLVWRLPGLASTLYDAWVDRTLPVLLLDPKTGKRIGRYEIPARGPAVRAWFDADTAVFATGDRVVWLK